MLSPATNFITGKEIIDPIIPVPITSPIQADKKVLYLLYNTPDKKAPKTAPVKASGEIPIRLIRIRPIIVAQARE